MGERRLAPFQMQNVTAANGGLAMDVGTIIKNQYRVVEHIGRGGMADVWSAQDTALSRVVAIKTIAHGLSADVDPVELFRREAQTIAKLEHPNILPIYDFGEFGGKLYIVMRFVTGGSLEGLLEKGPMPVPEVLRMGKAMANALDFAHTSNIIHLDLKPPNILLGSQQSPYLADFGLATILDPQGRARNPGSGTLLYMAPEQLTSDVIDRRADIYSFAIMLFHMLTGALPFDATTSLALKQLQYQESLPDIGRAAGSVSPAVNDALRRGTAVDPDQRPQSVLELIDELERALGLGGAASVHVDDEDWVKWDGEDLVLSPADAANMLTEQYREMDDLMLLEAVDIYSRAHSAWAGGQGRFLLGVSHYMLMSSYYRDAERHGLRVDTAGYQLLLRGALEYDHDVDFWWGKLNDSDRRWVCLHAVRSENAPARIRAFDRLEILPDDERAPQIPRLVAQALQIETYQVAKLAALRVLGKRAANQKRVPTYELPAQGRGTLLTTMLRINLELVPQSGWREVVYTPEIDTFVASIALDRSDPLVADFAARMIGQMRSTSAVRVIAEAQRAGKRGALRALALVRDESPTLPPPVTFRARAYAWLANSWRRMTEGQIELVWRFVLALLGGALGMGAWVYISFRSNLIFTPARWGNTIAIGLVFGVIIGFMVLFADGFSRRLRGFWLGRVRLVASAILGTFFGVLAWSSFTWFYLNDLPNWNLMKLGGVGLALGFILAAALNLPGWAAFLVTVLAAYAPIFLSYRAVWFGEIPPIAPPVAITYLLFAGFMALIAGEFPIRLRGMLNRGRAVIYGGLVGLLWGALVWGGYEWFFMERAPMPEGLLIAGAGGAMGFALAVSFKLSNLFTFGVVTLATWLPSMLIYSVSGVATPTWVQPIALLSERALANDVVLLAFNQHAELFTVGLPMAIVIALGGHAGALFANLLGWIGAPSVQRERPALLTTFLLYMLIGAGVLWVFYLFTLLPAGWFGVSGLAWSSAAFVFALAAWRWKRWGAIGMLACALIFALYRLITLLSLLAVYAVLPGVLPATGHARLNEILLANIVALLVTGGTLLLGYWVLRDLALPAAPSTVSQEAAPPAETLPPAPPPAPPVVPEIPEDIDMMATNVTVVKK